MIRSKTLLDVVDDYALIRGLADSSAYQVRRSVRIYGEWLGRPAMVPDLEERQVSEWIKWLELKYAERSRAGHRGNLISIWRHLAERGEVNWPGRIRRAPIPEPQPIAWTREELLAIRQACYAATGTLSWGVPRSLYLGTLFDCAYESGLRRSDLWRLERTQFRPEGLIVLRQHKTRSPHEPQISQQTYRQVLQLVGPKPLAWRGDASAFYMQWWRHVTRPAGVRHGVLQQIRRSGATQLEKTDPEATSRYLGHKTPGMKRHYVDRSQAYGPAPQPPRLEAG